jgi:hypothetical protein
MCAHRREKSIVSIRSIGVTMMMMKNVVVVKGSLSREKREEYEVVFPPFSLVFSIQTPKKKQRKTSRARNDQM